MLFLLVDLILYGFPLLYISREKRLERPFTLEGIRACLQELGFRGITVFEAAKRGAILLGALLIANILIGGIVTLMGANDTAIVYEEIKHLYITMPWVLGYLLTVRVIGEEIFFRGFLVPRFGIFWPALLFGLAHAMYGSMVQIMGAFLLGLILGKAFEVNKGIIPNIIAHLAYNGVILAMVL